MDSKNVPSLAPGERLNRYGQVYNFEEWKKKKIADGTWIESIDEWKKQKENKISNLPPEQITPRTIPGPEKMGEGILEPQKDTTPEKKIRIKTKKQDWVPIKDFIENRKRKNEEYIQRENKLLKLSDEFEASDDMSRRIVIFDTETTGLGAEHEIVEIAMIETIEGIKTGRYIHFFVNPDVENTKKAYQIHRLTKESLSRHPKFSQIAKKIASFVGTSSLMAHNAGFDMGMLNRGMVKSGLKPYPPERFICTKKMAQTLFPGERVNQDSLCHKFKIDNFNRETTGIHSAIEDTTQLYHVFRGMIPLLEKKNICWSTFRL